MKLLDLFCGAGGAAVGYHRAGFDEIVGVDIAPQPRYPFEFVQADAMTYPLAGFDAIHASPPCQGYSSAAQLPWARTRDYPMLIAPVRDRLAAAAVPYVIENVARARPHMIDPVTLCGTMFGLGIPGHELRRHRLFEVHPPIGILTNPCRHRWQPDVISVFGNGGGVNKPRGRKDTLRYWPIRDRLAAMGIDWMTRDEVNEAIPPAYTEFLGRQLIAFLQRAPA